MFINHSTSNTMSSNNLESGDESTPLISKNGIDSGFKCTTKKHQTSNNENFECPFYNAKLENSSSYPNISNSNDGNNNSNNVEENTAGNQEIKIYTKRWYILAVFSILGILQVQNETFLLVSMFYQLLIWQIVSS